MIPRSLREDCHLELKHIVSLYDHLARSDHVSAVADWSTVPQHHGPSSRATDAVAQCAARMEFPCPLVELLECLA